MKNTHTSIAALSCAVLFLAALQGCSSGYEVTSYPPTKPITIDGKADDWAGHLLYYRDAKLTVGVSHDKNFLYLCAMSSDHSVYGSIMMRGLTVWLDSTAGKGRFFGIRFPLGMEESGPPQQQDEAPGSRDEMMKRGVEGAAKLALLGAKKDQRTEILLPGKNGIEARMGYNLGVFVYELKVPLGIDIADGRVAAFSPDGTVGIRLETPESETKRPPMRDNNNGGMADGGSGGEGGMEGGGRGQGGQPGGGGHAPGGRSDEKPRSQSIDLVLKVQKTH